jgi:hypothetical protein
MVEPFEFIHTVTPLVWLQTPPAMKELSCLFPDHLVSVDLLVVLVNSNQKYA